MSTPYRPDMNIGIVSGPSNFSLAMAQLSVMRQMAAQAEQKFKALPIEEQQRINQEREASMKQRRITTSIQQGRCPDCGNRLIRGKKDKKNDYKRLWDCTRCIKSFSM